MRTAKKIQKLLALVMCIAMIAAMLVPTASAATTDDGYTLIYNESDLRAIKDNLGGKYRLANDITLTENWDPIREFAGELDGNGFAVRNLKIVDAGNTSWATVGLFGTTVGATVKNLSVYGEITNNLNYSIEIGSIVGHPKSNSKIINCKSYVNITTGTSSGDTYAGGIIGDLDSANVVNCVNYGKLTINTASKKKGYVGGVIGFTKNTNTIDECVNYGEVYVKTPSGSSRVGGICGQTDGATTMKNCVNFAPVTGENGMDHKAYVAGVLGVINSSSGTVTLTNNVNFGDIKSGCRYMGGVTCGTGDAKKDTIVKISYCSNLGNLNSIYTSSYNIWAGGIMGRDQFSTSSVITNCYNAIDEFGTVNKKADNWVGGVAGVRGNGTYSNNVSTEFTYTSADDKNNSLSYVFGYGEGDGNYTNNVVVTADTDLNALVATLNTGLQTPAYRINNGAIEPIYYLTAQPTTFIGTQTSKVDTTANTYSVRFISVINGLDYNAAGYRVSAKITKGDTTTPVTEKEYAVTEVYSSLLANNGLEKVDAPVGTYYLALVMKNVPTGSTVVFTVTPFGGESEGASVEVTCLDGAVISSRTLAE